MRLRQAQDDYEVRNISISFVKVTCVIKKFGPHIRITTGDNVMTRVVILRTPATLLCYIRTSKSVK